jgi:hypothetical protein
MALTPERLDLSDDNALHRRSRVGRFFAVDMPLLQKFVPASRRGWISGASMSLLPAGPLAAGSSAPGSGRLSAGAASSL